MTEKMDFRHICETDVRCLDEVRHPITTTFEVAAEAVEKLVTKCDASYNSMILPTMSKLSQ